MLFYKKKLLVFLATLSILNTPKAIQGMENEQGQLRRVDRNTATLLQHFVRQLVRKDESIVAENLV